VGINKFAGGSNCSRVQMDMDRAFASRVGRLIDGIVVEIQNFTFVLR